MIHGARVMEKSWHRMPQPEFLMTHQWIPGLTLLLASWLSWQDRTKFLLHLGNYGTHGKILIKNTLR